MHCPGYCEGKRCLSCSRRPDKEQFSYFIDPVTFEEFPVDNGLLDLGDDRELFVRTDKVLYSLLDLFRGKNDDKIESTANMRRPVTGTGAVHRGSLFGMRGATPISRFHSRE